MEIPSGITGRPEAVATLRVILARVCLLSHRNLVVEINAVGNEFGAIYDGVRSDTEDKSPTYLLPSSILPMTAQEMAAWKVYKWVVVMQVLMRRICPQKTVEDEWEAVKTIIANKVSVHSLRTTIR